MHDKVLIVDLGSQVTQLIARRVREDKVYCEIVPYQNAEAAFTRHEAEGGDPVGRPGFGAREGAPLVPRRSSRPASRCSASATASRRWRRQLGGKVEAGHHREFGRAEVEVTDIRAL